MLAAAAAGVALFLVSWGVLHTARFHARQIVDTPTYQRYGDAVVDRGAVPYRDFSLEYPPGALPTFVIPSLVGGGEHYRRAFEWLMLACGLAAVVAVAVALGAVGADPLRILGACLFAGVAPLLLGPVILTRFDLWPAALTAWALAAVVAGRPRLGLGLLAAAASAKVYPLVLVPLLIIHVSRRRGGREAALGLLVFIAVAAAILIPFALLSADGLWHSIERQTDRPLQIETLGGSILLVLHQLDLYSARLVSSSGSQNLSGSLPDALAVVQTALQIAVVIGIWALFAAGRASREALLAGSAAAVAAFIAFGKVLSPQFLIWLIPLVPMVVGRWGVAAIATLGAALVLTQSWFPTRYWKVVHLGPEAWLVLARNLVLCALVAILVVAMRRAREPRRSA